MRSGVAAIMLVLIAGLVGCRDNNGVQGPSVEDFQAERARLAAKAKQQAARRRGGAQVAHAKPKAGDEADYADVAPTYTYDPKGKRDPFRSFRFVNLRLGNALPIGPPEELFTGRYTGSEGGGLGYDIHPGGERFLMLQLPDAGPPQINVVQNWFEELKRLVPTGRNP